LQALRNKNVNPPPGMQPKKPDDPIKAFPPAKPSTAPAVAPQPQPVKVGDDKYQKDYLESRLLQSLPKFLFLLQRN
jgi:hypothetical protein